MTKTRGLTLQEKIYKAQRLSLYLAKLLQEIADEQQAAAQERAKNNHQ